MKKKLLAVFTIMCLVVSFMPTISFAGDDEYTWGDDCDGTLATNQVSHSGSCNGSETDAQAYVTVGSSEDKIYFHDLDAAIEYANINSSAPGSDEEVTATVYVMKNGITINNKHDGSVLKPITGSVVLNLNGKVIYNISNDLAKTGFAGKLDISGGKLSITGNGYFENYNDITVKNGGVLDFTSSVIVEDLGEITLYGSSRLNLNSLTVCGYFKNYNSDKPLITANDTSTVDISGYVLNIARTTLKLEGNSTANLDGYIYHKSDKSIVNAGAPAVTTVNNAQFNINDGLFETFCAPVSISDNSNANINGILYAVGGSIKQEDKSQVTIGNDGLAAAIYATGTELWNKSTLNVENGGILASIDKPAIYFQEYTDLTVNNYGQIATLSSENEESISYFSNIVAGELSEFKQENSESSQIGANLSKMIHYIVLTDEITSKVADSYNNSIDTSLTNSAIANAMISEETFNNLILTAMDEYKTSITSSEPETVTANNQGLSLTPTVFAKESSSNGSYTINIGSPDPDKSLNKMSLIDKYYSSEATDLSEIVSDSQGYIYNDNGAAIYSASKNGSVNVYEGIISGKSGIIVQDGELNIDSSDKNKEIIILGDGVKKAFRVFTYTDDYETGDAIILDSRNSHNPKAAISGNSSNLLVGLSYGVNGKADNNAKAVSFYLAAQETTPKFISAGTYATDIQDFLMAGFTTKEKNDATINKITGMDSIYVVESQQALISTANTSLAKRLVSYNGDNTVKPFVAVKVDGTTLKGIEVDRNGNPIDTSKKISDFDYTYYYNNWNSVGFAKVEVKAVPQGRYTGSSTIHYIVYGSPTANNLSNSGDSALTSGYTVNVLGSNFVYNSGEIKPLISVKFGSLYVNPDEYIVKYSHNVNAGTATVTVESKERANANDPDSKPKYSGETSFTIQKKDVVLTPMNYTVALGGSTQKLESTANGYYKTDEDAVLSYVSHLRYVIKDINGNLINAAGDVKDSTYKSIALTGENNIITTGTYTIEFAELNNDFSGMQNYNFILNNNGKLVVLEQGSTVVKPENPENVSLDVKENNSNINKSLYKHISGIFSAMLSKIVIKQNE